MAMEKQNKHLGYYPDIAPYFPGQLVNQLVKDRGPKIETTAFPTDSYKTVVFDQEHCTAAAEVAVKVSYFQQELARLINKTCMENQSNTPDFILAKYLSDSLAAFNAATQAREKWYGRKVF